MFAQYKVMCGCEFFISAKNIHLSLLSWRDAYFEKFKYQIQNYQSRRSGKKAHHIYETYLNTVMPHWRHIYDKASDMAKDKMCTYPQSDNALTRWKFVLRCFSKNPCINIPEQEKNNQY